MVGVIIVFEGLPGCGKSTVAREVEGRMGGVVVMPEVSEMAASKGFEVADRASIGTETWFLTQYYTRGTEALRLKEEGRTVIMDRNYASSLAFGFANFVASDNPSLFMHFPSYIVNKAVGTLVKPDAYIFFRIPVSESVRRQDSREEMREELRTESVQVLRDCDRFYKAFFTILEPEVPLYEVDATQPKDVVLREVLEILDGLIGDI
ncbi:MAG: AAA family ATPase [Candidatus Bathyarchaeota archaeon]|jgi:thymidylate kinase